MNIFANDPVIVRVEDDYALQSGDQERSERLHQLKALLDAGAINREEYAVLRQPLLEQLIK